MRLFIGDRCFMAGFIDTTADIGRIFIIVVLQCLEYRSGFECGGTVKTLT